MFNERLLPFIGMALALIFARGLGLILPVFGAEPDSSSAAISSQLNNVQTSATQINGMVLPSYDIVYVRQPRRGDNENVVWPEVIHPGRIEPGSDLMLLHPDGSEETLFVAGDGAVTDPFVSFDGQSVYFSFFHDVTSSALNTQRGHLSHGGSDIYRMHIPTQQVERLTHQEFTPNTGTGNWDESNPVDPGDGYNRLGYGILNLGPAPLAGGKIIFSSNRNGFVPTKPFTYPALQLFVMDEDGANVTPIAPMTLGSALHPTPLKDGRVIFSSYESQGLRDRRLWGLWSIYPDGRYWEPMISAFKQPSAFHFMTQLSDGDVVVEDYYNQNNWGFGALYRFPTDLPGNEPRFHSAIPANNPPVTQTVQGGYVYPFRMSFMPKEMESITPFTHGDDDAAPEGENGERVGKFTHPSGAPNGDLLVVYSPGPANSLNRPVNTPAVDAGLYVMPHGGPAQSPDELVLIKNDPAYNEVWPRALVPYQEIHGVAKPVELPWLPNDGSLHGALPAGTAYGLVGSSSFYNRETTPGWARSGTDSFDGLDAFNTTENAQSPNWVAQGADAGNYNDTDIWAVRLLAMEPNTHRSYGPNYGQHFFNHINEKLRILGEIPLRKFDESGNPLLDEQGNPDTSFLAKIPADTPFTFQTIDRNGMVLNAAQTWHQVRPGEMRADCGGCHAHSQEPLSFESTAAAAADYQPWDLTETTPLVAKENDEPTLRTIDSSLVNVEFFADIRPLLQQSCVECHTGASAEPPGNLVLDDLALYDGPAHSGIQVPGDYARLCFDSDANWGYPPLVTVGNDPVWRQTNASRYVRLFQSRRSLLIWKIFGERLDGWTNEDHPTESVPGDASTLPAGAKINDADLDFTGTIMPPPDSAAPPLSMEERMTVARWVDLGCPINAGQGTDNEAFGWFVDDVRPTVAVSAPRAGMNPQALNSIRFSVADAYSGIEPNTLSLTASIPIEGRTAGTELVDLATDVGGSLFELSLTEPHDRINDAMLSVSVADQQGNITTVNRAFSIDSSGGLSNTATPIPTQTSMPSQTPATPAPTRPGTTTLPTVVATPDPARLYLPFVD